VGEITDRCLFRVGRGGNALVAGDRILRFEERLGWFSRERRLLKGVVWVKWPGIGAIRPARNVAVTDASRTPQCGFETVLVGLDRDCETVLRSSQFLEDGVGILSPWSLREWGALHEWPCLSDVDGQPPGSSRLKKSEAITRSLIYAEASKGEVVGSLEPWLSLRTITEADGGSLPVEL